MSQPSVICAKELQDREVVGQAIMQMMDSDNPITYSNEPRICVHGGKEFIHGDLDLLFGERSCGDESHFSESCR